jgi:hypothetical protein
MSDLQAAYRFLRIQAFHDIPLPPHFRITRRPLKDAWGYWYYPNRIVIDSSIRDGTSILRIIAHELIHAAIEPDDIDPHDHGPAFKALAEIVCQRMGWSLRGF